MTVGHACNVERKSQWIPVIVNYEKEMRVSCGDILIVILLQLIVVKCLQLSGVWQLLVTLLISCHLLLCTGIDGCLARRLGQTSAFGAWVSGY